MANSDRIFTDRDGRMFVPMNVEGGTFEDNFITSIKVAIIVVQGFVTVAAISWFANIHGAGPIIKVLFYGLLLWLNLMVTRYAILEEKYYYRMYKQMSTHKVTTPAVFWDIVSMKDYQDGTVIMYSDMKIGVIIRLERDTITGKPDDFKEYHYDALSEFYKEINIKGYNYVQMNIMEQAGKDPRLAKLDELVMKPDNKNLAKLLEIQVGHVKNITRVTLYETDYFLIYTDNKSRSDQILMDVQDVAFTLMEGSFIGFSILSSKEILELVKDNFGVKYFDYVDAVTNVFKYRGVNIGEAFKFSKVKMTSGEIIDLSEEDRFRIKGISSYVGDCIAKNKKPTFKEAVIRNNVKEFDANNRTTKHFKEEEYREGPVVTDIDDLSFGYESTPYSKNNEEVVVEEKMVLKREKKTSFIQFEDTVSKNKVSNQNNIQQKKNKETKQDNEVKFDDEVVDF